MTPAPNVVSHDSAVLNESCEEVTAGNKCEGGVPASKTTKEAIRKANGDFARRAVANCFAKSSLRDDTENYPKFEKQELTLGKVLGKGGFGTVYEVRAFQASAEPRSHSATHVGGGDAPNDEEVEQGEMESRKFIADNCIRNGGDARYAVKILSEEIVSDTALYLRGIVDMVIETRFLAAIEHPNIIKLRSIAAGDPFKVEYFIVLDRLYDTLEKRLKRWQSRSKRSTGLAGKLLDRKGKKEAALLEERLIYAFDLGSALDYLHKKRIVYRDLKPENVGFDVRDDIKLFDFGISKELHDADKNKDGTYNLTGMTGSLRYMAPEVANKQPYNVTCDSYSFAVMFWQMLSLEVPYVQYTPKSLREKVYNGEHRRPRIDKDWSVPIKLLLKKAWCEDISARSSMAQICAVLRQECVCCRNGDETGLEHCRRRSTLVFHKNDIARQVEGLE